MNERPDLEGNLNIEQEAASSKQDVRAVTREAATEPSKKGHKWLNCMDSFSDFIQNVKPPGDLFESITVALIDDGVTHVDDPALYPRIKDGRSFSAKDGLTMPYFVSSGGHGTLMASLICRICPTVQFFVVKLEQSDTKQITAESAAKVRPLVSSAQTCLQKVPR